VMLMAYSVEDLDVVATALGLPQIAYAVYGTCNHVRAHRTVSSTWTLTGFDWALGLIHCKEVPNV
jgi:hypothetical protein